jgi:hypothetical protein
MRTPQSQTTRAPPHDIAGAIYCREPTDEDLQRFRSWLATQTLEQIADLCLGPPMNTQALSALESDPRVVRLRRKKSYGAD